MVKIDPFHIIESPEKRYFGFDVIRAFSVFLVMHMHFLQWFSHPLGFSYFKIPLPDPVDLFFVCSGFLIGYHFLIEVNKMNQIGFKYFSKFLIMRWFRTLPAYYFMLGLLSFLLVVSTKKIRIIPFLNFIFLQNFITHESKVYWETWTIAIEEWFYVLFPLLFILFSFIFIKRKSIIYLITLSFLILLSITLKLYYFYNVYTNHTFKEWLEFRELVVLRLDTISIGLFAAYIFYYHEQFWDRIKIKAFIFGFSLYLFNIWFFWKWSNGVNLDLINTNKNTAYSNFHHFIFFYILSPISIALCLPLIKSFKYRENTLNRFILYNSYISYSLFLTHGTFLLGFSLILFYSGAIKNIMIIYIIWIILCYLSSHYLYKKIELPFMKMRRKVINKLNLN
jgi:peptidoglycan/LPS O-acetylase OafA/YrhL